ncbi:hypothetical protein CMV_014253 [Castanea mollissima]|uniref:SKP1 component POZ domain-containing protein n=1 Tax=Castanea mollissima TaxID=60419 RepID=A0A8J4R5T8_9ROSI|nr:hypothetical protein CMV_014253 [Castanea mollissima]
MATYGGSSSSNPTRMVTFITSDDKQVKVAVEIARMSGVVRNFYDGDLDRPEVENADPFPLPNVRSDIFVNIVLASKILRELRSIYEVVEKERQELEANFFGQLSDKMIVDLVKAADYLEIKEVLDFVMPSVRKRFRLGDDKGVEFVYTAEAEAEASSDPNPTTMATFMTSDGKLLKVPVRIAIMFGMVKAFVGGELDDTKLENIVWPLPKVSSYVLDIVVYACKKLLDIRPKYDAVRQEFDMEFFGWQTDETIVEQVKAADKLEIEELLDFVMPSFRKRFGLGDDKGVEFVYKAEFETILLRRAAWAF